jgi:hypothetical protein
MRVTPSLFLGQAPCWLPRYQRRFQPTGAILRALASIRPSRRWRGRPRIYRYDPRSWYYTQRGYYPYAESGYWVPRAEMRYRYRYVYYGPRYQYVPAWGYDWWAVVARAVTEAGLFPTPAPRPWRTS